MPRHISLHSMLCVKCSRCFYGKTIKNKKKILCKTCRKMKKMENNYSSIVIYMFMKRLQEYEEGLYEIIKMYKFPVFHTEYFYNSGTNLYDTIFNISNFYNLQIVQYRYSNPIINYLDKNKNRLKRRFCRFYDNSEVILLIHFECIPLCYLPYIYINLSQGEKQIYEGIEYDNGNYEMIMIDYDRYELDIARKQLKSLGLIFNKKTGYYQSKTYK
jgi:hypothetical protein